ncbi:ecotin [Trypanosoma conorhini]|uniref:Ecotin n=1 Tax=Trypanosoma conorhini TaxID=83891 RepID=A0A3R7MR28_9TRYP|nr:ecotin [Trypanosoma conorhini]RNF09885.1 ecotin [Trypanosoma conorhini]
MSAPPKKLADYGAPYPEPTPEQRRYVIFLDAKGDEEEADDYKLQLIPGRVLDVDPVNAHSIEGSVQERLIAGWGYPYYVVEAGAMRSTAMAVPPGTPPVRRFVALADRPFIRYNSRLPVVVYVPEQLELHYRVWTPMSPADEHAEVE